MKKPIDSQSPLDRRDFHRLTSAALSGLVAGTMLGCGKPSSGPTAAAGSKPEGEHDHASGGSDDVHPEYLLEGKNVCRGLNHTCKGHKGGDNQCAGAGSCHTAAKHDCHGANECKGEGGCGANPGQNSCKGKGNCAVPLGADTWKKARAAFEKAMTDAGKKFGDAPAAG